MSMVNAASAAMKRQTVNFVFALAVIGLPATCYPDVPATAVEYRFESIETTVLSRGVDIPVTFIRPIALQNESFPLVLDVHQGQSVRRPRPGRAPLCRTSQQAGRYRLMASFCTEFERRNVSKVGVAYAITV